MKLKLRLFTMIMVLGALTAPPAAAGTEGAQSTFFGNGAGGNNSADTNNNTFIGSAAGAANNVGTSNTFLGRNAGVVNANGSGNTFLGATAGASSVSGANNVMVGVAAGYLATNAPYNALLGYAAAQNITSGGRNTAIGSLAGFNVAAGHDNVFLGYQAGKAEAGSNKLYIDNCYNSGTCTTPFIYGEFDNYLLNINGVTSVSANSVAKSQMHFSLDNGDYGGFLTSVLPNNFFVSSGARYDSGNWVQRSADGNAVMAGSGGVGYRIFTHTGGTVGNTFNNPTLRLQIDYSGQFGINTTPVAGDEIHTSSGAHLTSGGVWTDASSREYKEHIRPLTAEEAQQTLAALDPVRYNYKANPREEHVGFIAEDVPELVAREGRKSLSPMDIVAVLTKAVQEQRQTIAAQQQAMHALEAAMSGKVEQLRLEIEQLKASSTAAAR